MTDTFNEYLKSKVFHLISNTHWDREWRFPYQRNRQFLVEMMDEAMRILEENPEYRAFHLDSQTVVLTDYLQIKPQNEARLRKLMEDGRLLAGPWFILPDEFMVSGESLVRNLLLGHKIAKKYGRVSKTGYSPFSWGQISQLPQIYGGFGIDVILFYRGMNSLDAHNAEFIWEGPDGTKALGSRFSHWPRYNFYFYIYRPVLHNETAWDVEHPWGNGETPFHFADKKMVTEDYHIIEPENGYYEENLKAAVEAIVNKQAGDFTTPHVIWMEGHDSSGPHPVTARIVKDIKRLFPEMNLRHSTLEDYVEGLKADADWEALPKVFGERRSAQYDNRSGNLYGYITSARTYLKQEQFDVERWLEKYAEPFYTLAGLYGLDTNDQYLAEAWRMLLENTAHDSIGGCSLDSIHDDMMTRYRHARQICEGLFSKAIQHLIKQTDRSQFAKESLHLHFINPLPFARTEVAELYVDIPQMMDEGSLKLRRDDGSFIPLEILGSQSSEPVLEQLSDRPMFFKMQRYHCVAKVELPPLGLSSCEIVPALADFQLPGNPADELLLENELLRVNVSPDGTFAILHKKSGVRFNQLGYFYDEGEAGHAWVNSKVEPFYNTLGLKPEISSLINNSLMQKVQIAYQWPLPKNLEQRISDTPEMVTIPMTMTLELRANTPWLDITVEFDNLAEDHRLRMAFPTGIAADETAAEGQFDVVKRTTERPDTTTWVEQPMYDFPFYHFVDISSGSHGLALLSDGLKEYEFLPDDENTLAVTLIRAFRYVIQPASKQDYHFMKGSQVPGKQRFHLALAPHTGDWEKGGILPMAQRFNYEIRAAQSGRTHGKVKEPWSFVNVANPLIMLDAIKTAEDVEALILRLHNSSKTEQNTTIHFAKKIRSIAKLTLEELHLENLDIDSPSSFSLNFKSREIITLKLEIGE
jgi:mannosylglycerate hydrolase